MTDLILPAATLFRFNSGYLSLNLADISPEHAIRRMKDGSGSSIAYLVGHITSSRYGLLKALGMATENPNQELFGAGAGSKDGSEYPPISELEAGWDECAEKLHAALDAITDEAALTPDEGGFPIPDQTVRGRITFVAWHECYHVGQIGLLRTELGYPSMKKTFYSAKKG